MAGQDFVGDFAHYITHINWVLAGLFAAAAIAVAFLAVRVAGRASDRSVGMGGRMVDRLLHGILWFRADSDTPWLCGVCQSVNVPSADRCYRGCGRRRDVEAAPPADVPGPEDFAEQHGGRMPRP